MLTLFYYDRYYDFCPFETVFRSQKYRNLLGNDELSSADYFIL